jgi:anti-sigma regulatory factor (Ser/Thr protein kinase)
VVRAAGRRSRSARISVTDRGSWNRAHRTTTGAEHRGHGLAVMGGCVAEVHLQRSPVGTSVLLVSFPAS